MHDMAAHHSSMMAIKAALGQHDAPAGREEGDTDSNSSMTLPRAQPAAATAAAKRTRVLRVDLSGCKYELLHIVADRLGWQLVGPDSSNNSWDLCWLDTSVSQERLLKLGPTQRINHWYGMLELARKRPMARTVSALASAAAAAHESNHPTIHHPTITSTPGSTPLPPTAAAAAAVAAAAAGGPQPSLLLDFMPPTWALPQQLAGFLAAATAGGRRAAFILKPDAGCQGRGIRLVMGGPEAAVLQALGGPAAVEASPAVAQQYVVNPLLVNGLKFDLRVYCLVTSVQPLRIFLYKDGLVRFCTTPYKKPAASNLCCSYMHLTNYAVNKHNAAAFVAPTAAAGAAAAVGPAPLGAYPTGGAPAVSSSDGSSSSSGSPQQQQQHGQGPAAAGGADASSKWSFQQLQQHLEAQGADWPLLWSRISQLVTKSLIAVTPHLAASYKATVPPTPPDLLVSSSSSSQPDYYVQHKQQQQQQHRRSSSSSSDGGGGGAGAAAAPASAAAGSSSSGGRRKGRAAAGGLPAAAQALVQGCRCFEVLGFDVLIDADLKPWLIEVNHSPSFNIDSQLDRGVKEGLVVDTVNLLRLDPRAIASAKRAAHKASRARLLTHSRLGLAGGSNGSSGSSSGSSSGGSDDLGGSSSSGGCSAAVLLEAQQEKRAALLASMDAWQGQHLGGYERAYPLVLPTSSSSSSGQTHSLQYAKQQQELYDQLLLLSQRVYLQQQQQQWLVRNSSPARQATSPSKQRQQQSPAKQMLHQQQRQQQQRQPGSPSRVVQRSVSHLCPQQQQRQRQQQQQQQQRCLQKSHTSPSRVQLSCSPLQPGLATHQEQQQQQQQSEAAAAAADNSGAPSDTDALVAAAAAAVAEAAAAAFSESCSRDWSVTSRADSALQALWSVLEDPGVLVSRNSSRSSRRPSSRQAAASSSSSSSSSRPGSVSGCCCAPRRQTPLPLHQQLQLLSLLEEAGAAGVLPFPGDGSSSSSSTSGGRSSSGGSSTRLLGSRGSRGGSSNSNCSSGTGGRSSIVADSNSVTQQPVHDTVVPAMTATSSSSSEQQQQEQQQQQRGPFGVRCLQPALSRSVGKQVQCTGQPQVQLRSPGQQHSRGQVDFIGAGPRRQLGRCLTTQQPRMLRKGLAGSSDLSSADGAGSSGSSAGDWATAAGSSTPPTLQSEPCIVQLSLPDRLAQQQQQQQVLSTSSWGLSRRQQHDVAPLAGKRLQQQQSPTKPPAAGQSPAAAASSSASQQYLPQLGTAARLLCGKRTTTGGLMGRLDLSGALLGRQWRHAWCRE